MLPLVPAAVKPLVTDGKLQNYVNDFYKGVNQLNRIGNGTTADAIRNEISTDLPTQGKWHFQKGQDLINGIEKWLRDNPNGKKEDVGVAVDMLEDLYDAMP